MKLRTSVSLTACVLFVVALVLLQLQYPWHVYAAYNFSKLFTAASYLIVAAIVAAIAAIASFLFLRLPKASVVFRTIVCGITVFGLMLLWAVLFGPMGWNIPGTRIRGIFFSEFEFLGFVFFVAVPVSFIAAALCGWFACRHLKSPGA
jgi:hypothetical protein